MKILREFIERVSSLPTAKHSFYGFYPNRVKYQYELWQKHLPFITPHYAIKSNPEEKLLKTLQSHKVNFDCASLQELKLVKELLNESKESIVYANPCKSFVDLQYAQSIGSPVTVVDSFEEVDKLSYINYSGGCLIRIMTDDKNSKMAFSGKFGIEQSIVNHLGIYARTKNLSVKGISFHVGSGGNDGVVYTDTITIAKNLCAVLQSQGHEANTIDIGGGFLSDERQFIETSKHIKNGVKNDFHFNYIAEPGRYFSSVSQDFFVKVIGKKPWKDGWRYTIDDSLYGQFSCIPFDHAKPLWIRISDDNTRKRMRGLLMGRTCDSVDVIARSESMESLEVGDWLWFPHMGSYTNATANEFNGFPKPELFTSQYTLPSIHSFIDRIPKDCRTLDALSSKSLLC